MYNQEVLEERKAVAAEKAFQAEFKALGKLGLELFIAPGPKSPKKTVKKLVSATAWNTVIRLFLRLGPELFATETIAISSTKLFTKPPTKSPTKLSIKSRDIEEDIIVVKEQVKAVQSVKNYRKQPVISEIKVLETLRFSRIGRQLRPSKRVLD